MLIIFFSGPKKNVLLLLEQDLYSLQAENALEITGWSMETARIPSPQGSISSTERRSSHKGWVKSSCDPHLVLTQPSTSLSTGPKGSTEQELYTQPQTLPAFSWLWKEPTVLRHSLEHSHNLSPDICQRLALNKAQPQCLRYTPILSLTGHMQHNNVKNY